MGAYVCGVCVRRGKQKACPCRESQSLTFSLSSARLFTHLFTSDIRTVMGRLDPLPLPGLPRPP